MQVKVLNEAGYNQAVLGFSLSYNSTTIRAKELLPSYAFKQGGENKFLESILLWLDVIAPRFWWQEADTYRISTKQSESTMHTFGKESISQKNFENTISLVEIIALNDLVNQFKNKLITLDELKGHIPEGFLQRRIWCMSYKTLQNIYRQRINHRLPQWKYFCAEILNQIEHPEFIEVLCIDKN